MRSLCEEAYFYGEETGGYEMSNVENAPWFEALSEEIISAVTNDSH